MPVIDKALTLRVILPRDIKDNASIIAATQPQA